VNEFAMYEVAKQRIAEMQDAARRAGMAREQRAAARARRAGKKSAETIASPVIPDFAHEMFNMTQDTGGSHARSGR
jgi:hypothetical protein